MNHQLIETTALVVCVNVIYFLDAPRTLICGDV
jgi:hypothetical protein